MTDRTDLVAIGHAYGPSDAALALSILDAAGIAAISQNGHTLSVIWNHTVALGGTAILVPCDSAETARELLADFRPESRRPSLLAMLFFVLATFWTAIPTPASGYFPAPAIARGSVRYQRNQ